MKLIAVLFCVTWAAALAPATIISIAAKSKAAQEIAGGVSDIFQNMGDKLSNNEENIVNKEAARSTNLNIYLDIMQKINSGELKVKRELLPEKDVLLEKLVSLYNRVRAYVNGGAEAGLAAYAEVLDQLRVTYERFSNLKSLAWLKRWVQGALEKIEEKLDEYEQQGQISVDKREIMPSHEEVAKKFAVLYERLRILVNGQADEVLETYQDVLNWAHEAYGHLQRFKSLQWLKRRIVDVINILDKKLQEYAIALGSREQGKEEYLPSKRELLATKEELLKRLGNLYNRFRAYVNAGADTAEDAYGEGLDYIRYLINRFDSIRSLQWATKWIVILLDRAEKRLSEYENGHEESVVERREVIPPKEEALARIGQLYDRLRGFVNHQSDAVLEMYKGALDEIRNLYEHIERMKSLSWLKRWTIDVLNSLEAKLNEWEKNLEDRGKRSLTLPSWDQIEELGYKITNLAEAGMQEVSETLQPTFDRLVDTLEAVQDKVKENETVRKVEKKLRQVFDELNEKVDEMTGELIDGRAVREAEAKREVERVHELYRRELISNLEEHFDERTARGLGKKISGFFKDKWAKINGTFAGFKNDTKVAWAELIKELKPVIASVERRGNQILDDTKNAAIKIRQAAIKSVDDTIHKMLVTANNAINDGRLIVDTLKNSLETFAQELK